MAYRTLVPYLLKYFVQISLLLTSCSTIWALRLFVPESLNHAGAILLNVSFDTPRLYQLSGELNAPFVSRFFDVTPLDGVLYLKRVLKCRSESPADLVPTPVSVFVESRTFQIDGSSNHLTVTHVEVHFQHVTCEILTKPNHHSVQKSHLPHHYHQQHHNHLYFRSIEDNLNPESVFWQIDPSTPRTKSNVLLSLNVDKLCINQCQCLTRLSDFVPIYAKQQCTVYYHVDESNGFQFKIEHHTTDLISLQDVCLQHGPSFDVNVVLYYQCNVPHHNQTTTETSVLSDDLEQLTLTFYARDVDVDNLFNRIHQQSSGHNGSGRSRRETSTSGGGPSFDRSLYIVSVPEEREKSFVVTQIVANHGRVVSPNNPSESEMSTSELLYTMSALIDARSQSMFSIDPVSGLVTTTTRLDREFMDVHYLRITVTDGGVPPKTATTTLQINVMDENDHVPVFEHANYEASIRESAPIGTTVLTVRATDHDSGPNAEIEYSILNPTGANEVFRVDSKQGVITTRATLDREKIDLYTLTIQASDTGSVQSRKRSHTTIGVKVLDENDNYPQFAERSYSVAVDEDINYASRPVIARVVAHDFDEGLNAAVRYSIIGGNTAALFHIDSLNGEVSVVGPLDYENARSYRLVVRAQDGGSPPRSNTTQLLVSVVDKNDNEPRFYTSLFQENVFENVPIGTSVLRVQAYDSDDGENAQLSYFIQNGPSPNTDTDSSLMPISVDPTSGWIVTTRDLDREEASMYEFTVIARDSGQPMQHSATASVIIQVQDLNDNAPVFEPRIYETVIPETAVPGTPVISVTATDRDENSRLVFQVTAGNIRNRFSIVSQHNQGHITVANQLDYKQEKNYVLTVTVTDPGGKMDLATVYINVTDANTHSPVIQLKNGSPFSATSITVPEDAPVGTTILVVEAIDDDVGENARITYFLNEIAEFRIDPNSGSIVTTKPLDRETTAGYTLVVTAQDNGIPPLSDIANVEIEVVDVNDNVPLFEQNFYSANVMEDAPLGTSVVQVRANDRDLGLNGQVRYEFDHSDTSAPGTGAVFMIDATSGVVRTNKTLDRETTAKYELKVVAYDRGNPPLSSVVSVHVTIEDCKFCFELFELVFLENHFNHIIFGKKSFVHFKFETQEKAAD